jgi:hypothetical protein
MRVRSTRRNSMGKFAHVSAIRMKQIEGDEDGIAMTVEEVSEVRPAPAIEAHDLATKHSRLRAKISCWRHVKRLEGLERVPVARH